MKKTIFALLSVTTILFATAGHLNAQGGDRDLNFIPAKNHAAYVAFISQYGDADNSASVIAEDTTTFLADNAAKASLNASKANSKASKNFAMLYKKEAAGASWSMSNNAIVAYFSKDNVKTDVVYNTKGQWVHTLTYFPEDRTPGDIASIMDYAYPKDDVKLTVKVEEGPMMFYIVQLEGKTTIRKVTVYNGEVNQIEELTKSK
jgi:hypothetical protein